MQPVMDVILPLSTVPSWCKTEFKNLIDERSIETLVSDKSFGILRDNMAG